MPEILDIFNQDAFSAVSLTDSVNMVQNTYGRLNELHLFGNEPVMTTSVAINISHGVLNLLPTRPRGGPASLGAPERQKLEAFVIPHIPHDDSVLAVDVQNMLARAPSQGLESVLGMVNRKLITMRRKHAITLENLRVGAIKGVISDYDGTPLINLFDKFGITPKVVDFTFGTASTDVGSKCREVSGYIEDNLMGDTMTGVMALCSPSFFDRLVTHASVKEAYKYFVSTQNPLRNDLRKGFTFQNITFEEYRGSATKLNEDGTTTVQRFIPDGDARFFPLGTTETFANYWAPPDFVDEVNTAPGLLEVFVAPLERMKFGKGIDIHTESNPLPLCKRPSVLVRGFSSN
ncbi:major capsid protein [Methylobacterium nodulans]|uniref:Putative phage related protein n=1 Tax=Methylobacterium nodulans (strain LMG 21967 / CNCM I-2342 / ORS 2060) TaxID=460265 RepID=B8ISC4_METNO|nr:major capsid protein [Methylobacterium nodulans]ACL58764.1 putative phage related protein [Methylobacterium nodulans ORS 2060]